mgnify:CR=1 FL=1
MPQDVQDLVKKTEADIKAGKFHPFTGPIKDNEGKERVAAGKTIDDATLKSARNLAGVRVALANEVTTYDIVWADKIVLTGEADPMGHGLAPPNRIRWALTRA